MPETESIGASYVTANECRLATKYLHDKLSDMEQDNEKVLKILQGNGEGGLILKVNSLLMRNQLVDKGLNVGLSITATLITLYLTGALNL